MIHDARHFGTLKAWAMAIAQAKTRPVMGQPENAGSDSPEAILDSFNQAWRRYWEAYIELQDQLYETLRAAREVQWLVATDQGKVSEVNRLQRELFASVPRPLDYVPLSQVSLDLDSAPSKIGELDAALSSEEEACRKMNAEIGVLKTRTQAMKEALQALGRR
jgi:hypothetical protein